MNRVDNISKPKIILASDHAGYRLKNRIKEWLEENGYFYKDLGTISEDSVDYPDYGLPAAEAVSRGQFERGILICGSGIGMSIVANKVPSIRAALCTSVEAAKQSREHLDSNILVLAGRNTDHDLAIKIVSVWLNTEFIGGRHSQRIEKIKKIEEKYFKCI